MEKILFGDIFTKTFKNVMKIPSIVVDDPVFRLHYRFTGLALLFSSIMVSAYQFFGNPILCIQRDDIPETLLNTYCWVEGTFTLPKALSKKVGEEIVYPGVDTHNVGDEIVEHAYYQWVCFVLLLQSMIFCVPHVIWRAMENKRMKALIQQLAKPFLKEEDREDNFSSLVCYFRNRTSEHNSYARKFVLCEALNFIIVVSQIYFINRFLGGEFTKYGINVVQHVNDEQQDRIDPMIRIFPRITKCTFHKYGSSGSVQKHDALCLLPLNILNEKIFVVMWFWFVILAVLGGCLLIYRLIIMNSKQARFILLSCVASLSTKSDIRKLIPDLTYGDWFMLYLLADNIDNLHFHQIIKRLIKLKASVKDGKSNQLENKLNSSECSFDDNDKGKNVDSDNEDTSLIGTSEKTASTAV